MLKFDEDIEMTEEEKQEVIDRENNTIKYIYNDIIICEAYPEEVSYCKEATGYEFYDLLIKMLTEINKDIFIAIKKLCKDNNEPYNDDTIPDVTAYEMQKYVDNIVDTNSLYK